MKLKTEVKENTWTRRAMVINPGITSIMPDLSRNAGWGNGYVGLPKEHPCYGMGYDDIHEQYDIDVHGGLTFSEQLEEGDEYLPTLGGLWVVGFDTAHYTDNPKSWPKSKVQAETDRLREQLEALWNK